MTIRSCDIRSGRGNRANTSKEHSLGATRASALNMLNDRGLVSELACFRRWKKLRRARHVSMRFVLFAAKNNLGCHAIQIFKD